MGLLPFAENATFDSAEILGAEAPCLPGTQRAVLDDIQKWAENPEGEAICWLHGMAGTGKTSIALTVANALNERQPFTDGSGTLNTAFLGASFFFKQGDSTRNSTKAFFPTLARCLAEAFPDLKTHIVGEVKRSLAIGSKAPQQQIRQPITKPLSTLGGRLFLPVRLIVVVDAIDECLKRSEADELLSMLVVLQELHQVQLRLLITSRLEAHIRQSFDRLPKILYRSCILDKVEPYTDGGEVKDDISLYLTHMLDSIAAKNGIERGWISQDDIKRLSHKADGLFIYAATACRYLDAEDFVDVEARQERLDQIFQDERTMDTPQQRIDEIYTKVLSLPKFEKSSPQTKQRIYSRIGKLLGVIVVLFEPLPVPSVQKLLPINEEPVDILLNLLRSILNVPQDDSRPIGLARLSFRDFILNEDRTRQLHFQVNEFTMHRRVLERCLEILSSSLRQDICNLVQPGKLSSEVPQGEVAKNIPQYLRYACRYWVDHLAKLENNCRVEVGLRDGGEIHKFLQETFLFWLEAMSLIRETPTAILTLEHLQTMISVSHSELLLGILKLC